MPSRTEKTNVLAPLIPYSLAKNCLGLLGLTSLLCLSSISFAFLNFSLSCIFNFAWHIKQWNIRTFITATQVFDIINTIQPVVVLGKLYPISPTLPIIGRNTSIQIESINTRP